MSALLEVRDLKTSFHLKEGIVPAVDGVSFSVWKGESVGIVGESGCGKSVTALSIMGLLDYPGKIDAGSISFCGEELLKKNRHEMRKIRGSQISMIFQEPMTSLNPLLTIGEQISEVIRFHQKLDRRRAREQAVGLLKYVGIPAPEKRIGEYPYQFSGGMRQRVMIAIALSCNPKLLIADEPTTALDVTIQAQILQIMKQLNEEKGMAILMITHDLGIIAEMTQRVIVMYAGGIVEEAETRTILKEARHPYTKGLLASIPQLTSGKQRLDTITGTVPRPTEYSLGCRFHPRCPDVRDVCRRLKPPLRQISDCRRVKCWMETAEYNLCPGEESK